MIRKQFILIFIGLMAVMSGCGQSGPLYLPPDGAATNTSMP